jgi:hypothetical protein
MMRRPTPFQLRLYPTRSGGAVDKATIHALERLFVARPLVFVHREDGGDSKRQTAAADKARVSAPPRIAHAVGPAS